MQGQDSKQIPFASKVKMAEQQCKPAKVRDVYCLRICQSAEHGRAQRDLMHAKTYVHTYFSQVHEAGLDSINLQMNLY